MVTQKSASEVKVTTLRKQLLVSLQQLHTWVAARTGHSVTGFCMSDKPIKTATQKAERLHLKLGTCLKVARMVRWMLRHVHATVEKCMCMHARSKLLLRRRSVEPPQDSESKATMLQQQLDASRARVARSNKQMLKITVSSVVLLNCSLTAT